MGASARIRSERIAACFSAVIAAASAIWLGYEAVYEIITGHYTSGDPVPKIAAPYFLFIGASIACFIITIYALRYARAVGHEARDPVLLRQAIKIVERAGRRARPFHSIGHFFLAMTVLAFVVALGFSVGSNGKSQIVLGIGLLGVISMSFALLFYFTGLVTRVIGSRIRK